MVFDASRFYPDCGTVFLSKYGQCCEKPSPKTVLSKKHNSYCLHVRNVKCVHCPRFCLLENARLLKISFVQKFCSWVITVGFVTVDGMVCCFDVLMDHVAVYLLDGGGLD